MAQEQVIQGEVMLNYMKQRNIDKEKKAALAVRIKESENKIAENQEFIDYLKTL